MIRFQRIGRKNDPAFRIVVLEKTAGPKAGKYVALVGIYNPKTKATNVQAEQIKDWVAKGAQISPSVMNLLITKGVYTGKKTQVISKKNLEKNLKNEKVEEVKEDRVATPETAAPVEATDETPVTLEEAPVAVEEETPVAEEEPASPEVVTADEEVETVA